MQIIGRRLVGRSCIFWQWMNRTLWPTGKESKCDKWEEKSTWWFSVDFNIYWPKNTLMLRWSLIFVLLCRPIGSIFLCNSLPLEVVEQKSFKDIIWRDIFLDISFMFTMHMHFLAWLLFFKKASVCQYHYRKWFYLLRPDRHSYDLIRPAYRCGPISKLPDFCQQ